MVDAPAMLFAVLVVMTGPGIGYARTDDGFTTFSQPTASLAMPFDNSEGFQTLVQVSNVGFEAVSTHWSFWSGSGAPLGDVAVCLTSPDTIVVFLSDVSDADGGNNPIGEPIDLTGQRGFLVVTAYGTDARCAPPKVTGLPVQDRSIVGSYRIYNVDIGQEFVSPAPGFGLDAAGSRIELPSFEVNSFFVGSSNPEELLSSQVVMFAVQESRGSAGFEQVELGPPANPISGEVSFPTGDPRDQLQATAPFSFLGALFDSAIPGGLLPVSLSPAGGGIIRFARFKSRVGDGVFAFGSHAEITDFIAAAARERRTEVTERQGIFGPVSAVSTAGYERLEDSAAARSRLLQWEPRSASPAIRTQRRSVLQLDQDKIRTFSR